MTTNRRPAATGVRRYNNPRPLEAVVVDVIIQAVFKKDVSVSTECEILVSRMLSKPQRFLDALF